MELEKALENFPLMNGIEVDYFLLEEVIDLMYEIVEHFHNIDKIITTNGMGISLATGITLRTGLPFSVIKDDQTSLKEGERVVLVDVILNGHRIDSVLKRLKQLYNVKVLGVVLAVTKSKEILRKVSKLNAVPIFSLQTVDVSKGKIILNGFTGKVI